MVIYFLGSLFAWLFVLLIYIGFFPLALTIWLFTFPFDCKLKLLHRFTSFWGVAFIWAIPFIQLKISGREKIMPNKAYVMVSNHQSLVDILAVYRIYAHFKWVAKRELFKIPILGWTLKLNRYIPVDRANKASHIKMMKHCEENLLKGNSLMIFPEGTRSKDGTIQVFKEGAFKLALLSKVPILPIVLHGTGEALPKKGFIFKKTQTVTIKILDPIPFEEFENLSAKETMNKVRDLMVKKLENYTL